MPLVNMMGGNPDSPLRIILIKNLNLKITNSGKDGDKIPMPVLTNNKILPLDSKIELNKDDMKCAPGFNFTNGSCMPVIIINELVKAYNKYYPDDIIPTVDDNIDTFYISEYKKFLISEMKKRFKGDQKDWVNEKFAQSMNKDLKHMLSKDVFRPKGPKKQFEWMSSLDMNDVMRQYEHYYPDFKYLGSVPIDFDDIDFYNIKNINYNELIKNGKTKFGMIINNQTHSQGGQHWFCLYFNLISGDIFFVDSANSKPMDAVNNYVEKIKKFLKSKDIEAEYKINTVEHQQGNSECGVYSMYFILRFLKTGDFEKVTSIRVPDEKINEARKIFFSALGNWEDKDNKDETDNDSGNETDDDSGNETDDESE